MKILSITSSAKEGVDDLVKIFKRDFQPHITDKVDKVELVIHFKQEVEDNGEIEEDEEEQNQEIKEEQKVAEHDWW